MDRQIRRLGIAFVGLFAVLFGQIAYVQVFAADRIANDPANAQRQIIAEYKVQRGAIFAADSTVLARSVENPDPKAPYRYVREYPGGDLYGHITGYYSRIFGRAGLEQSMNAYLAGTAPALAISNVTDLVLGRPKKGGSVYTTIEPAVQRAARDALGSHHGAVAAIDPENGSVLALYSNPGFDPLGLSTGDSDSMRQAWEQLNADLDKPLLSKASQELYLPGSTFKLVTASAALENGWGPERLWQNPPVLDLPTTNDDLANFGGSLCNGGSSQVTMAEAFQESCNVTFGEIGLQLGPERLSRQASEYGLCLMPPERTDCPEPTVPFELPFENGRFPEPAYFGNRVPALAYSAVGLDNDKMNPLQLALISGAIANGGTLYEPRIVSEVRDPQGRVVESFGERAYGRAISTETAVRMRDMMVSVVNGGTGYTAAIPGVTVAGKTGTATNGDLVPPNAWFTAFAPAGANDTPRVAVAVIVLNGGDLGNEATGGRVAAPIAKQVIEAALAAP
jgi:peptidoglycan glycosyltransferase